jgi:Leucine rich repeat
LELIEAHTFRHLHKLLHLELRHNQIRFIDAEAFAGCTYIKILHLQVRT